MREKCPNCLSLEIVGTPICANCHAELTWTHDKIVAHTNSGDGIVGDRTPSTRPVNWPLFGVSKEPEQPLSQAVMTITEVEPGKFTFNVRQGEPEFPHNPSTRLALKMIDLAEEFEANK